MSLTFDMKAEAITAPTGNSFIAIKRGPVVLSRDSRLDEFYVDDVSYFDIKDDRTIKLERIKENIPENIWMVFELETSFGQRGKKEKLRFCDYASAGNTWEQDNRFRVWLPQLYNHQKPFKILNDEN